MWTFSVIYVVCSVIFLVFLFKQQNKIFAVRKKILLHTTDSFEEVWITQTGSLRSMHFCSPSNHIQSCCDLDRPRRAVFLYQKMILVATALITPPNRIAVIGLGGGSLTMHMRHLYPNARIVHVEINPRMKDYAKRFFLFQEDSKMEFYFSDAAKFFQSETGRMQQPFDLIVLDAFDKFSAPAQFFHRGFYQGLLEKLTVHGLLLGNTCYHSLWRGREEKLYNQIFPCVLSAPPLNPSEGNRILLAFKTPTVLFKSQLESRVRALEYSFEQMDLLPQVYWHKWLYKIAQPLISTIPANPSSSKDE